MCKALVTVVNSQDKSRALLDTLTISLSTVYSPYEVVSVNASRVCSIALAKSASLATQGHLQGLRAGSLQLADLISLYVIPRETVASPDVLKAQYRINIAVRNASLAAPLLCVAHQYTYCTPIPQHTALSVMTTDTAGGESSVRCPARYGLRTVPCGSCST
jgi:hypothetical protein